MKHETLISPSEGNGLDLLEWFIGRDEVDGQIQVGPTLEVRVASILDRATGGMKVLGDGLSQRPLQMGVLATRRFRDSSRSVLHLLFQLFLFLQVFGLLFGGFQLLLQVLLVHLDVNLLKVVLHVGRGAVRPGDTPLALVANGLKW